jgi:hypothetical protein
MSEKIWGIEIVLDDCMNANTTDTDVGLYQITTTTDTSTTGQKILTVADTAEFRKYDKVFISEDPVSEINYIASVDSSTQLTMVKPLQNSYTGAGAIYANSCFRWLQNNSDNITTPRYTASMIVVKGLQPFSREINLKRGGNIADNGGGSVTVKNTSQFFNFLKTASIYFNGLTVRIYLYTDGVERLYWTGVCEQPSWNTATYTIPLTGMLNRRRSNISTEITTRNFPQATETGKIVPITFGRHDKAKFIRTAAKESLIDNTRLYEETVPAGVVGFPVVVAPSGATLSYEIAVGNCATPKDPNFLIGMYVRVIDGSYSNGEIRKITGVTTGGFVGGYATITITIAEYFTETLTGNSTATASGNSWVEIVEIFREYAGDTWPCKDFLDTDGSVVSQGAALFSYDSKKQVDVSGDEETAPVREQSPQFARLPQYGYKASSTGSKNRLTIDTKQFDSDPDELRSFLVLPVTDVKLITDANLTAWEEGGFTKDTDGLYYLSAHPAYTLTPTGSAALVTDKDKTSSWEFDLAQGSTGVSTTGEFIIAVQFKPPVLPDDFEFDAVYLGIKADWVLYHGQLNYTGHKVYPLWKRFMGARSEICTDAQSFSVDNLDSYDTLNDIPDIYCGNITDEEKFYVTYAGPAGQITDISGYKKFEMTGVNSIAKYRSITDMALLSKGQYNNLILPGTCYEFNLSELCLIFEKKISVKDQVYTPFKGRVYGATWGGRVTATDLVENPRHLLEKIVRLQNWSETSLAPTGGNGWGWTYSDNPLIRTGYTDNSFDGLNAGDNINDVNSLYAAQQISDFDAANTDDIKRTLCRNFSLANWVSHDGAEQVIRLKKSNVTPTDTITLADIIDRKSVVVTEPAPSDIFCNPYVRYMKNPATGEYDSVIRFTNADALAYESSFLEAPDGVFSSSEAEEYWTRCHALYLRCRSNENPPSDLTDLRWANGVQDNANAIAKQAITSWIDWMFNPVIRFKVHFDKAGQWEECHRFILQLPHQTDDAQIECITQKITINPNSPYDVTVEAIMFSDTIPSDFYYQDVFQTLTSDKNWQDNFIIYGDTRDKQDTI